MLSWLSKRSKAPNTPFDFTKNPYKAKRPWPPDFGKLSHKQQFKYERTYRRRAKLKWARPVWNKTMTIVQWTSIGAVLVYGVFFMDVSEKVGEGEPFQEARQWYRRMADSIWTHSSSASSREAVARAQEHARARHARDGS